MVTYFRPLVVLVVLKPRRECILLIGQCFNVQKSFHILNHLHKWDTILFQHGFRSCAFSVRYMDIGTMSWGTWILPHIKLKVEKWEYMVRSILDIRRSAKKPKSTLYRNLPDVWDFLHLVSWSCWKKTSPSNDCVLYKNAEGLEKWVERLSS